MNTNDQLLRKDVYDNNDEKVGTVDSLYLDDSGDEPVFVTVKTGMFSGSSFVPLRNAKVEDDRIVVPYSKDQIKNAPNIEQDQETSEEEEQRLYEHYGLAGGASSDASDHDTVGHDVSGPETDDAMTISAEELNVGTRKVETGRYRLRKYVVTENVTKTVPVQREEVRLEREPITEANAGAAMDGPELSDEVHEVVTHAEVPVVEKTVIPQERIRINKDVVSDEETVDETVRREEVDVDSDGSGHDDASRR
ncbi:MAG TPA: PRC and DUF2382 domain-containing protein [Candidatus Saccharimonadales bacterium]|jgi:uncharacterized protein (TIGR02271 family)